MPITLIRAGLRYLLRHGWQAGLCILGVALGVAMVVSIDLSNASARRAFTLSTEAIAGRATHQIVGGPGGLDEAIYRRLRVEHGLRTAAPIVEGYVSVPTLGNNTMQIMGIDPFAEPPFRSYLAINGAAQRTETQNIDITQLIAEPATALMADEVAQRYGVAVGDSLTINIGSKRHSIRIIGLLHPHDNLSRHILETMLITDIATAQELLGMVGKLSRIDLILAEPQSEQVNQSNEHNIVPTLSEAQLRPLLPAGAVLTRPAARSDTLRQMTRAFELNLSALSLLALIVGMFLIYNTMTFSVVQRRALLGTLRCIGVTRRQVFVLVLVEALGISIIGSLIGLGLGIVLGRGLVQLVTRTINDLYFVVTIRSLTIAPEVLIKGAVLGIVTTMGAAAIPAREATLVPPRMALQRSSVEERIRRLLPVATLAGIALCLVALVLLFPHKLFFWQQPARQSLDMSFSSAQYLAQGQTTSLVLAFLALFAILIGCALLVPILTTAMMQLARPLWSRLFGFAGRMAARAVVASLSRTSVAIAALMVAISVTIGVGTMVESFRQTVVRWLDQSLAADVYISPPSNMENRVDSPLDLGLIEELLQTPGVAGRTLIRGVQVQAPTGPTTLLAIDRDKNFGMRALRFKGDDNLADLAESFDAGSIFISEPLAYRTGLVVGDSLPLQTDRGMHTFSIAGIYYDYTSERGVIQMAYPTYRTYWDDPDITSCAIYATPDTDVEALVQQLREQVGGRQELIIRSHHTLRQTSLDIFDRTFAITSVLQMLATIVAFIGVLSALMALQLERTREIGMLRANGLTPSELWTMLLSQTGLMGLTAGIFSLPVGMILALVLIYIINRRSFGWTLELIVDPWLFVQAVVLAVVAALLAGIYPAWRMGKISPAVALREE